MSVLSDFMVGLNLSIHHSNVSHLSHSLTFTPVLFYYKEVSITDDKTLFFLAKIAKHH